MDVNAAARWVQQSSEIKYFLCDVPEVVRRWLTDVSPSVLLVQGDAHCAVCPQERFQVKNPPHTYIQKLRGYLDPGVTRKVGHDTVWPVTDGGHSELLTHQSEK